MRAKFKELLALERDDMCKFVEGKVSETRQVYEKWAEEQRAAMAQQCHDKIGHEREVLLQQCTERIRHERARMIERTRGYKAQVCRSRLARLATPGRHECGRAGAGADHVCSAAVRELRQEAAHGERAPRRTGPHPPAARSRQQQVYIVPYASSSKAQTR
jgi:hypothetical protein